MFTITMDKVENQLKQIHLKEKKNTGIIKLDIAGNVKIFLELKTKKIES